eukprot:584008-Rhodomonas_salina.1
MASPPSRMEALPLYMAARSSASVASPLEKEWSATAVLRPCTALPRGNYGGVISIIMEALSQLLWRRYLNYYGGAISIIMEALSQDTGEHCRHKQHHTVRSNAF